MDNSLIFMLPLAFMMGVLGRFVLSRTLNVEHKNTSNTRIKRDYFDAVPNERPEREHTPDDDTHSVILEAVEKRLWKLWIHENDDGDILETLLNLKWFVVFLALCASIISLVRALVDKPTEFLFSWAEELDALIDPYKVPIFTSIIVFCVVWFVWNWLAKRLRLLKDVRNRNYECKIMTRKNPAVSPDGVLEVAESNAQEDCVRFEIYFNKNYWHYRHMAVAELMIERKSPWEG